MNKENAVVVRKDYGRITFHFDELMDKRGINRNQRGTRAGIRFEVADRLYSGRIERLDVDV